MENTVGLGTKMNPKAFIALVDCLPQSWRWYDENQREDYVAFLKKMINPPDNLFIQENGLKFLSYEGCVWIKDIYGIEENISYWKCMDMYAAIECQYSPYIKMLIEYLEE